jgi:hypothetical protein
MFRCGKSAGSERFALRSPDGPRRPWDVQETETTFMITATSVFLVDNRFKIGAVVVALGLGIWFLR